MIKINFNSEVESEISINNINYDSIVGVKYISGHKGIILMYEDIVYVYFNDGEFKSNYPVDTQYKYLKYYESNIKNAFVFKTAKECFKWMSE